MNEYAKDNGYIVGFILFDDLKDSDIAKSFNREASAAMAPYLRKKGKRELKILEGFPEDTTKVATSSDIH